MTERRGQRRTAKKDDSLIDQLIDDRYHIRSKLGAGGVGVVYRAEHVKLRRDVAVKVLQREYASRLPLRRRFEREARAMAALDHPNIVQVTDFGVWGDLPYIVMELLEGRTYKERLEVGRLGVDELLAISRQLLKAAEFAHEQGLVHRDLKPANIILTDQADGSFRVSILDFGLAKFIAQDESPDGTPKLTVTGMAFGTPAYMAPEQAAGGKTDRRTDLYSIGIMLFESITGSLPFQGDAAEMMRQHLFSPPPKLAESMPATALGTDASPALEAFVEKVLAKERSKRFKDALEMLEALEGLAEPLRKLLDRSPKCDETAPTIFAGLEGETPPTIADDTHETTVTAQDLPATGKDGALEFASTKPEFPFPLAALPWILAFVVLASISIGAVVAFWDSGPEPSSSSPASASPASTSPASASLASTSPASASPASASPASTSPASTSPASASLASPSSSPSPSSPSPPESSSERSPHREEAEIWEGAHPTLIAEAKAQLDGGRQLGEGTAHSLLGYAWKNKNDARPLLLLARYRLGRGHLTDAVDRYEKAYAADQRAKTDPNMLHDLVKLSLSRSVGWRAARAVKDIFGSDALPALNDALNNPALDPQEERRLRKLQGELLRMSR